MVHCYCLNKKQSQATANRGQGVVSGGAGNPNMFCTTGEQRGGVQDIKRTDNERDQRVLMCCCPNQGQMKAKGQGVTGGGASGKHNENVCHATGERRRDIINKIKNILNDFDERPCQGTSPQKVGRSPTSRLGESDEYIRLHCQSWMPPNPRPPLISSVQTHEIRPTEDYDRMVSNNNEYITYVDARNKPPPPSCDCAKRNGLQDQCEMPGCKPPTAQCLASNPGPCCPPSMGLSGRPSQSVPQGQGGFHGQNSLKGQSHFPPSKAGGFVQVPNQPSPHREMFIPGHAPKGQEIVCFCEAEPDNLPSGKKYMCCPVPASGCQ